MEMKEYREMGERLTAGREDYERISVPKEMKARLEAGIERALSEKEMAGAEGRAAGREERMPGGEERASGIEERRHGNMIRKNKERKNRGRTAGFRIAAAVAAAAALFVILPNTGADVAHAMGSIPVVGGLFRAVTFRDYQYESDRFDASVEVPQIVVEPEKEEAGAGTEGVAAADQGEASASLQQAVEQINFDIDKVTDQLIREFQEQADAGESHGSLEIHHETVTDNEDYFTLKLSIFQAAGSGYQSYKFYTVDKKTGKQVQLGDLFEEGSGFDEAISEDIKDQMRDQMAEDENKAYWVDREDMPGESFERLREDQNFYFDEAGDLVIVFDEYEVAPGYMGVVEFTVERAVFEGMLK